MVALITFNESSFFIASGCFFSKNAIFLSFDKIDFLKSFELNKFPYNVIEKIWKLVYKNQKNFCNS